MATKTTKVDATNAPAVARGKKPQIDLRRKILVMEKFTTAVTVANDVDALIHALRTPSPLFPLSVSVRCAFDYEAAAASQS